MSTLEKQAEQVNVGEDVTEKPTQRFVFLLALLTVFFLVIPMFRAFMPDAERNQFFNYLATSLFIFVLLSAIFANSQTPGKAWAATCLGAPAVILELIRLLFDADYLKPIASAFQITLIIFSVILILHRLSITKKVTFDCICSSICAYLFIAIIWALVYELIERHVPGSFASTSVDISDFSKVGNSSALYFSMATITTLGYGDIVPTSHHVRLIATCEAVFGQVYLTVLVARLVGLHISNPKR